MALRAKGLAVVDNGVKNREEFTNGNIHGYWVDMMTTYGQIPYYYGQQLKETLLKNMNTFVIYSYVTPIAWWANGEWTVPDVTYSNTTTNHQNAVRSAIARFHSDG